MPNRTFSSSSWPKHPPPTFRLTLALPFHLPGLPLPIPLQPYRFPIRAVPPLILSRHLVAITTLTIIKTALTPRHRSSKYHYLLSPKIRFRKICDSHTFLLLLDLTNNSQFSIFHKYSDPKFFTLSNQTCCSSNSSYNMIHI